MTDNTQELDEILKPLRDYAERMAHGMTHEYSGNIEADLKEDTAKVNSLAADAKQAITAYTNKQIEAVLARLHHEYYEVDEDSLDTLIEVERTKLEAEL